MYAIGVYRAAMEFIETPTFTRLVAALLSDEEYRALQNELLEDPERCLLYTSPSPRDGLLSRMPSSA